MSGDPVIPEIRIHPQAKGPVVIEVGGEASEVPAEKERPTRPNPSPPWVARVIAVSEGEEVAEVERGAAGIDVEQLAADPDTDGLKVFAAKSSLSPDELKPLIEVARKHDVDIDVHLLADG